MSDQLAPTVLCILDGWGLRQDSEHNAVALANTPTFDRLWQSGAFATSQLDASGEKVGLPAGQIGNSEVGHLNIGAGNSTVGKGLVHARQGLPDNSARAIV